ncbi:6653_t:CDS:2, partial [Cetraspora pellucida]
MFVCCICKKGFGRLTSLINHKKAHKTCYQIEDESSTETSNSTDESTNSYISDKSEIISRQYNKKGVTLNNYSIFERQDIFDESYLVASDTQKINPDSDPTFDNQQTASESDSFNDQETVSESNSGSMFDNQETVSESESMFDDESVSFSDDQMTDIECVQMFDKENDDESDQMLEEDILKDYKETIDEFWSDDNEHDNVNFPNVIYRDFVIRHQLSYTTGDAVLKFVKKYSQIPKKTLPRSTKEGLYFLDTLEKNYIKFFSTPVEKIRGQEYSFKYHPIISAVKEILQDQEIALNCGRRERIYSEFYNCNWWCRVQQLIPTGHKVLAIILYSDATTLDRLGKNSRHPIFISLGNIPTNLRNKAKAKALVGFIPTLEGTMEERKTPEFRQLIRLTFHKCINILMEPLRLQYRSGILLKVNSNNSKFNMVLASIIGDWPENCKSCLTYNGASCAYPCHTCLVKKDELNAIKIPASRKITCMEDQMRQIIAVGQGEYYSIYKETNSFWNHLGFNVYTATVPERMHYLDLGLFPYMVKYTRDLLKTYGGSTLINKMDLRFGLIPRYPGLKVFSSGLADLALFTASEYKHMMKIMPFVLEGLIEEKKNESLIQMFINWNKMYHQSRQYKFTQSDLLQFE